MRKVILVFLVVFIFTSSAPPSYSIEKKPPKRMGNLIAVFDFDIHGNIDKSISRALADSVSIQVVKSGKYEVIDRMNIDKIFREQAFQMTGSVTKERAVEAGQLLGVGKIIVGSLSLVGKTYYLTVTFVDVETGKTVGIEEDSCKCEVDEVIASSKRAADKLLSAAASPEVSAMPAISPPATETIIAPPPSVALPTSKVYKDPNAGLELVFVKGGCFEMGNPSREGDDDEKPVHQICLGDYYIGRHEVTQGQWQWVMGDNPSKFKAGPNYPVDSVKWEDATEFVNRLNQKTGNRYRLPTEAEWEYAARSGGRQEKWSGTGTESGLAEYAWYTQNGERKTHPAGQKRPNSLGLYDMSGNVAEWVSDIYDDEYYEDSPKDNPIGPKKGDEHVIRGGHWSDRADNLRNTNREKGDEGEKDDDIGFRIALPAK